MKICAFCNGESPDNSKFCSQCGQKLIGPDETFTGNSVTRVSGIHALDDRAFTAPENTTSMSSGSEENKATTSRRNLPDTSTPGKDDDLEHEILYPFDDLDAMHTTTIANNTEEEEEEEDEDVLIPFPHIPGNAPVQPAGNVLAQGPLNIDQVPYGGAPHIPLQPAPMATPPAAQPAQLFGASPPHQYLSSNIPPPPPPHTTISIPPGHSRKHHRPPNHRPLRHIRPTCLVVVIVSFIVFSVLGVIIIALFPRPTSTLTSIAKLVGSPIPGQKMILHGGRFAPGETVIVLIDYKAGAFNRAFSSNSMSIGGLFFQHTAQTPPPGIKQVVGGDGTFSLTIIVDPKWPVGSVHTVYVYKQDGTLIKLPPFVVIIPSVSTGLIGCPDQAAPIRLGPISEASPQPVSRTITLCGEGSGLVNWNAHWDQKWLALPSSGRVQAPQGGKLTISASAKGLKPGAYTTTIVFSSRQSITRVPLNVVLVVVKAGSSLTPPTQMRRQAVVCVSAAPQSVSFADVANQPTILSKNVNINNCGDAGKWSASATTSNGKPWLGVGPSQGTIRSGWFQAVTITASSAVLAPGTYSGQVTFHIGSSSAVVEVMFSVRSQKTRIVCIDASSQSLTFVGVAGQSDPPSKALVLINCGVAGQWSISPVTNDGTTWIHPSLYSHILKEGNRQQISVSVSSAQLTQGTYTGKLIISMGSSSVKVNIIFIVEAACIRVDYPSLLIKSNVGGSPLQDIVTITNCGYVGTWYGSASTDGGASWLTIDRTSGQLAANASQRIAVDVSAAQLHEGTYTGNILFIMGASRTTVRVKFIVVEPDVICISVNTQTLNFTVFQGEKPDPQVVTVGNCGNTTEAWTSSLDGTPWIGTDLAKGNLNSGDAQDIRVTLSSARLSPDTYTGHITFSTGSSSRNVQITLTVQKHIVACITGDQSSLAFSSMIVNGAASTPHAQTVNISNCGDAGSLSATPITDDGAMRFGVTLANKNLGAVATSSASVTVDSTGLGTGTYTATIPFTIRVSTGAQDIVNVRVTLNVSQQSQLPPCKADPPTLTFTSTWGQPSPSAQTVTLRNCGANDTWSESDGSDGLFNLDAYSGTLDNNGSQVVSVVPDGSSLNPGQHMYTLTFTTGAGETALVDTTWNILQPPNPTCIEVDSSSLSFPDQNRDTSGVVSFSNCGAYKGNISVTASAGSWLTISPYRNQPIDGSGLFLTGYGPSISVNADGINLPPGPYSGTINATITTSQGSASVPVNVTFTVPTPPLSPTPTPAPVPTDTPVVTDTPIPTNTPMPTDTPTDTPVPTDTPTDTPTSVPPTDTPTSVPPTDTPTSVPPTDTPTAVPPTDTPTSVPPTDTPTAVPPTDTPTSVPPTDTPTSVPPTDTPTAVPPTDTPTSVPPTNTPTAVPPTDTPTSVPPTDTPTSVPPTDTPTPGP